MITSLFGVLFDGFAYGMLLFLLSVGLSVTLGMMNFVNLAHCAFGMIGGYVTVTLINRMSVPFLATLPLAFLVAAAASVVFERTMFRRLYRSSDLDQCLLTIGLVFVAVASFAYAYGTVQQPVQLPSYLRGSLNIGGVTLGIYRIFLIVFSLAVTALLVLTLEYTRFGAQIRAAVDNRRMAESLGINIDRLFAVTFGFGSGMAALGGGLGAEFLGLDPQYALKYLVYFLIVVAVGGLGRVTGVFYASLIIGVLDFVLKKYVPQGGTLFIYVLTILLLLWRPQGLFGKPS